MTDTESIGRTESTGRPGTPAGTANIGVVGMAVMGSNLARNLAGREGNTVVVYNRSPERTRTLVQEHPEAGFLASESIDDFVASLARPRTAIIMVQAGRGTDAVIEQLAERFERRRLRVPRRNMQPPPVVWR
jgi:6-phosphogluconate dehydrogenase